MVLVLPASGPLSGPTRTARGELDTGALLRAILADPAIQRANEDFLNKLVREAPVPATCRSACAMMGEEALVDFSLSQWHVGSADATTCLILAVVCPVTRKAWAAHYNSSLVRRDASIAALLPTAMRQPHAYLVGSFAEASGESAATLAGALALLHDSPLAFRLRLACVDAANTDPATGGPRAINLVLRCAPPTASADAAGGSGAGRHEGATEAVEEAAGQAAAAWEALAALPGVGEPSPTGFEDRGPEMSWRLVRGSVEVRDGAGSGSGSGSGDDSDADEADGENEGEENTERGHSRDRGAGSSTAPRRGSLCPIVETATGRLRIPGHRVRRLAGQHLLYYSRLLSLPDRLFLQYGSTSPDHEPPHFVDDFRKAYAWMLQLARAGVGQLEDAVFEWAPPAALEAEAGDAAGEGERMGAGGGSGHGVETLQGGAELEAQEEGQEVGQGSKVAAEQGLSGWRRVRGGEGTRIRIEGVAAGVVA
ncbi:hypothetical protein CHLRE_03g172350v5 [Chlamydomonas reinhardtii]|uniref:Uncharacterized protein n=1 Tax=Chlamydomonas reinhardtii TaxID=3055 RepID=A0A2K3DX54_CHLRE|nr:uncharacterized protein CHLRE_03g172350v5 [Chlamydomonas reinhardtii]PNW85116.1 hypothetical protein CHLRE_03g172350v5 [Chlamydomonas reinhardtii]